MFYVTFNIKSYGMMAGDNERLCAADCHELNSASSGIRTRYLIIRSRKWLTRPPGCFKVCHSFLLICKSKNQNQGPVVQSVVSLTNSLRVVSLTVLADSIHNILIFFAEKNVSSLHFFSKQISKKVSNPTPLCPLWLHFSKPLALSPFYKRVQIFTT